MKNRFIVSLINAFLFVFIVWLSGQNFDKRCPELACTFLFACFLFGATWFYPGWSTKK